MSLEETSEMIYSRPTMLNTHKNMTHRVVVTTVLVVVVVVGHRSQGEQIGVHPPLVTNNWNAHAQVPWLQGDQHPHYSICMGRRVLTITKFE